METAQQNEWTPERLRALMKRAGLSANGLAAAVDCHQVTVEYWLRGARQPSHLAGKTLERLEAECREREGQS